MSTYLELASASLLKIRRGKTDDTLVDSPLAFAAFDGEVWVLWIIEQSVGRH